MMLRVGFRTVDSALCNVAKSCIRRAEENPPEIFMQPRIMHIACSAGLFAEAPIGARRRSAASLHCDPEATTQVVARAPPVAPVPTRPGLGVVFRRLLEPLDLVPLDPLRQQCRQHTALLLRGPGRLRCPPSHWLRSRRPCLPVNLH